ncbi:MAG TPA: SDR family oxidoreductase [Anaerolineales bacterium]|nr:SDR family oxidoreductase [Anaerolineales bacterium]
MKILILGGTVFLGRALVEAALQKGHQLTLFNRGKSNPDIFPEVEKLVGERDSKMVALQNRRWDAVIDTCGYIPRVVRRSAELLANSAEQYIFISSLSVYADASQQGITESAAVGKLADETTEQVNGDTYGPLKALCEQAVEQVMPGKALIVRPGLIVGPHDPTDRFTYWPWRVAQGGDVLAPGWPERAVQFIDVRDLAEWIILAVEIGLMGIFNTDSSPGAVTMGALLDTCRRVSGSQVKIKWVNEDFLLKNEVQEWIEMPLWIPESSTEYAGFFAFDASKAISQGLKFRPTQETVKATLAWANTRPADHAWRAGLSRQREEELLREWAKL